jgi:hypothetical protein
MLVVLFSTKRNDGNNISADIDSFYSSVEKANASNTGVVKLAAFVRIFAQKVAASPRPRALTCYEFYTIIRYILVFWR